MIRALKNFRFIFRRPWIVKLLFWIDDIILEYKGGVLTIRPILETGSVYQERMYKAISAIVRQNAKEWNEKVDAHPDGKFHTFRIEA